MDEVGVSLSLPIDRLTKAIQHGEFHNRYHPLFDVAFLALIQQQDIQGMSTSTELQCSKF